MDRKIVGFIICMLLILTAIPNVSGNNLFENRVYVKENSIYFNKITGDILFSDDFDDNKKDFDKWSALYDDGIWEETNGR